MAFNKINGISVGADLSALWVFLYPFEFVKVHYQGASEARIEMQGFGYLVAAYAVVWIGLFVFLAVLMLRIRGVRTELAVVEQLVREQQEKQNI